MTRSADPMRPQARHAADAVGGSWVRLGGVGRGRRASTSDATNSKTTSTPAVQSAAFTPGVIGAGGADFR